MLLRVRVVVAEWDYSSPDATFDQDVMVDATVAHVGFFISSYFWSDKANNPEKELPFLDFGLVENQRCYSAEFPQGSLRFRSKFALDFAHVTARGLFAEPRARPKRVERAARIWLVCGGRQDWKVENEHTVA